MAARQTAQGNESFRQLIRSQTPLVLFIVTAAAIFLFEIAIMLLLHSLPELSVWKRVFVDAALLVLLLFPVLYFFMFRPLRRSIFQLYSTQERLNSEIAERTGVEATLRKSEKQLRLLSSQLLRVQEKERRRVARELHEELGVTLAALKLSLRFVARGLRKDQEDLRDECEQNLKNLDDLIDDIRRLSRELSPSPLEDIGLSAALRRLAGSAARDCHFEYSSELEGIDHLFPEEAQIHIYRIFQEALSNVEKHAHATRISLAVAKQNNDVSFSLEDDGRGFDLNDTGMKIGLTTMFERARMLGGSLDVRRNEAGGARIVLIVPVPDHPSASSGD